MRRLVFAALLPFTLNACGDDSAAPGSDAGPDGCHAICGDGIQQCNEQCDDGNTTDGDGCSHDCKVECGDGVKQANEKCDTAIPAGQPGACPTSCDDQDPCTTDNLNGTECQLECVHGTISACQAGDKCCPSTCNAANDSDCSASCGNGVVDPDETCDTGIASGQGSCPTSCNDNIACTMDTLMNAGTCTATCSNVQITTCTGGDGCCPSGCTHANDNDCSDLCGNGVVDQGETCDTAITSGTGKCPATPADCTDNNACTTDSVVSAGTCMATCSHTTITACANGDGCCPSGCNANNDDSCPSRCGNGILEPGETCDDGNTNSLDGCSSMCQIESYRVTQMAIEDPHVWIDAGLLGGCTDATNSAPLGQPGVNQRIATSISSDTSPMDGFLDLNVLLIFRPLNQAPNGSTPISVTFGKCTAPESSTMCRPGAMQTNSTATNHSTGQCLGVLPNTHTAAYGNITVPSAPCFDTPDGVTLTVQLNGIMIPLQNARVAATYSGNPATQLVNGEIRGFISETDANNTLLPTSLPFVGGHPLSSVLAGGVNCCHQPSPAMGDKDVGPDGSTLGWYFYLSFTAAPRPYVDMP